MSSIISYIASIANIANKYSALITAIATVALAILTAMYLREIRHERRFRLLKEHTEDLKRKVIGSWLSEMERIGTAERRNPPLPIISSSGSIGSTSPVYEGKRIEVESEILFNDLKNHKDFTILLQTYEKFKEKCRELSKEYDDFKKNIMDVLSSELRILSWDDFYRSVDLEPGFFEKNSTLDFFLDSLLSGCKCKVEFDGLKELHKNSEKLYGLLFSSKYDRPPYTRKYRSGYGKYIDKEIKEEKKAEIKATIEALLERCRKEFKEEIDKIHELVGQINESRNKTIEELRKLMEKTIFSGECEFIGIKK